MNRSDLIRMAANQAGLKLVDVEKAINAFLDCIVLSLACGETVKLKRFGNFELRTRKPTVRMNPQTGAPMEIPEITSVAFIAGDNLRSRLNARPQEG